MPDQSGPQTINMISHLLFVYCCKYTDIHIYLCRLHTFGGVKRKPEIHRQCSQATSDALALRESFMSQRRP